MGEPQLFKAGDDLVDVTYGKGQGMPLQVNVDTEPADIGIGVGEVKLHQPGEIFQLLFRHQFACEEHGVVGCQEVGRNPYQFIVLLETGGDTGRQKQIGGIFFDQRPEKLFQFGRFEIMLHPAGKSLNVDALQRLIQISAQALDVLQRR